MSAAPPPALALPDVTLLCADTANHALALRALARSCEGVRFARAVLLTDALPAGVDVPRGIEVAPIAPLASRDDYSKLVLKGLLPHIATQHALLVQWDGYIVHPEAWDPEFLERDYIGAKWFWHDDAMRVGNGGFSLRSRRLLEALQDPRIVAQGAEDETICRTFRPLLEREHGIRFADEALADRFSFEGARPVGAPFGFHGLFNFARVVPAAELAALAPQFSDAIACSPQCLQLLRNCRALGKWAPTAAIAARIVAADADHAEARAALAAANAALASGGGAGRNEPCPCGSGKRYKHCHGSALATATPNAPTPDALVARALAAHRDGDLAVAERDYRAALAAHPAHAHAEHFLGVVLYQRGDLAGALPLLEASTARVPGEAEFHNNTGLALAATDRTDDAIAAYRNALACKPDHATAWNNLGLALTQRNDVAGAEAAYRRAIALDPDFAQAHWNLALALLVQGDFEAGWREYEWRLRIGELPAGAVPPGPRWEGGDPAGRTLLLAAEQGFGDTLQFVRFAGLLAARGAKVIVHAPAELAGLVATAPGVHGVAHDLATLPPYDAQLPLLSVAGALGVRADTIPAAIPYLRADAVRIAALRAELARTPARLRVGLAWAGRPQHANDRRRSCPLAACAPLFALPDIAWYSLQRIDGEDQIAALPDARNLILHDARNGFDGKAALIGALDLVISVDTSIAHLAGALGAPVWVMLAFAPEWRWQLGRSDSPWYPSARLFRQAAPGDWNGVVAQVCAELAARVATEVP